MGINLQECAECVRFRVICETWNGIIVREHNTITELKRLFHNMEFRKVDGEFDHQYAVDYELYNLGKLICGIQIKPQSYTWNAPHIQKARIANKKKNEDYFNMFGRKVFDIISAHNGSIKNPEIIDSIKSEVSGT